MPPKECLSVAKNGKNGVLIDNTDVPVFVAERNSMHALNGDRVKVHLSAQRPGG